MTKACGLSSDWDSTHGRNLRGILIGAEVEMTKNNKPEERKASTEATEAAGHIGKRAQSGQRAENLNLLKVPEIMERMGLTKAVLIEKYLIPLLSAKNERTRLSALELVLQLMDAYPRKKTVYEEQLGYSVDKIIIDIPRPQWPDETTKTEPPKPQQTRPPDPPKIDNNLPDMSDYSPVDWNRPWRKPTF
jgi:hypothetical protein